MKPAVSRMIAGCRSPLVRYMTQAVVVISAAAYPVAAQRSGRMGATITGRVTETPPGRPIVDATVSVEGSALIARTDTAGYYRLLDVPAGPQVLQTRRFGYAPARVSVVVPASGVVRLDIEIARTALQMREVQVTADVVSRARGELGTATVVTREAISNLGAPSLAGVLELLPGIPLQAPGLDNVQQVALRAVPTTSGDAERLASFGTLIILDGVPLSNNANLQSVGPRGEVPLRTSAGGGIDIRRIPAAALERVEVIRGVPSARYGDLTQGAIVIDTRAGVVAPEVLARYDPNTREANFAGGWRIASVQTGSMTADIARTLLAPGATDASVWRGTVDLAHRLSFGASPFDDSGVSGSIVDTRLSVQQLYENSPEQPEVRPGRLSNNRSGGARLSQRARFGALARRHLEVTLSVDRGWQNTFSQTLKIRGAEPFTDRLTEGRSTGHYVGGAYPAALQLAGAPWNVYSRIESVLPSLPFGGKNMLRAGAELRREWNSGPGYQFAIEFPPQSEFNGVNGYDRPRRFDAIPAIATTAAYVDDRLLLTLAHDIGLEVQGGWRADVLHKGSWWTSGPRKSVVQPRFNAQLSPRPWLRLRWGWGQTAKLPPLSALYPAPQFYDVVNVNWYPPDSAERLAVLTTFIKDPSNPGLGFAVGHKSEAGVEADIGRTGAALSVVAYRDRTVGGVGFVPQPSFLLREHFALADSAIGTGRQPTYVTPAQSVDTVPVFVDRPRNLNRVDDRGIELTISLPEIPRIQTRVEVQGAWATSRVSNDALGLLAPNLVSEFQLDSAKKRSPYWVGSRERGERSLLTGRFIHHQAMLGLVLTGTIQYFIHELTVQEGATDTLSWVGYVTRAGQLVPVARANRSEAQYSDLRRQRFGVLTTPASPAPDWLFNLQVAKSVVGAGRFSFYAFNALDRFGQPARLGRESRYFPRLRFGAELSLPTSVLHKER